MCLFEDPSTFGDDFNPGISKILNYSILADSTVLLDANQKLARLNQFVDAYGKSGLVNLPMVLQEIAMLSGLDPSMAIIEPAPKPPEAPNISLRLTGVEDLLNPLALAFLINSGQAPKADLIEQAKQLIQQSVVPPQPPPGQPQLNMPGAPEPLGGLPMLPAGAPPPGAGGPPPPGAPLPPPSPAPPPGTPLPSPPPPKVAPPAPPPPSTSPPPCHARATC